MDDNMALVIIIALYVLYKLGMKFLDNHRARINKTELT